MLYNTVYYTSPRRPTAAKIPSSTSELSAIRSPTRSPDPRRPRYFQSNLSLDLLSPYSITEQASHCDHAERRPPFSQSSIWRHYSSSEGLNTGTPEVPPPLLTAHTPGRQPPARLPTVPIPRTPLDTPWAIEVTGLMSNFEPVPIKSLIVHTFLCLISFPFVYILSYVGSGKSLFYSRAIAGAVSSVVGLTLGYYLIRLSRRGIEAVVWATIIHESTQSDGGVTLGQLDSYIANSNSPFGAISLLLQRTFRHTGAKRTVRGRYDRTPWSIFIIIFLIVTVVSACLMFIFARIVCISTQQERQLQKYTETTVIGDLSPEDTERAATLIGEVYSNYNLNWSLIPLASGGVIPIGRSFTENRLKLDPNAANNVTDTVYFAETYPAQLAEKGHGFGTFSNQHAAVLSKLWSPATESRGHTLRWPRWGIRAGCMVLDELDKYLLPFSPTNNMTYLFVPKTAMYSLFASMDIRYPGLPPVDFTSLMTPGDSPPPHIAQADTAVAAKWWPNGVSHSLKSVPISDGSDGNGWIQVDIVLVRLHQSYAPNGTFSVYVHLDPDNASSVLGYDAAICVEEFKPYMVDVYNNTASTPTTMGLVHRGLDFDKPVYATQPTNNRNGVQWGINSKGKASAFRAAYINSRNVLLKDNGRDFYYVPNPTLISFTNGSKAFGYTKLDPLRTAAAIATADSQNLLPYLAGSQPVVARYYPDKTIAYVEVSKLWLAILLLSKLPLGLPRRDFGVFSWLAAIDGDAIVGMPSGIGRHEHLEELKRRGKYVKVRYAAPEERHWALPETERAHREFFERQYTIS